MFGVYEEYPICTNINGDVVGLHLHEWQSKKIATKQHGIPSCEDVLKWNDTTGDKYRLDWFFDIGVIDPESKRLCYAIEIVHKCATPEPKIKWLKDMNIHWIEINADWVMNCVRTPFNLHKGVLRSSIAFSGKDL